MQVMYDWKFETQVTYKKILEPHTDYFNSIKLLHSKYPADTSKQEVSTRWSSIQDRAYIQTQQSKLHTNTTMQTKIHCFPLSAPIE